MKLVCCSNLVIGTNGFCSVCCGKHVGCNTGTCDENRTFETILQCCGNQLPDILKPDILKPSGLKSAWNQATVFFVGFRLFALRDKSSRDKWGFSAYLFRWKTKLRRPYAIGGHPRSNADPQLGYGKLIPVQSPKQPLASPCQSFFQFFTTFTTKMNQNLTAFDSFLEVHCFHRNMLSHLSQTSAATITISWTFQILKKKQWTSELTMLWAQTMNNGRKRWSLLTLLEMNNLDTQKA